MIKPYSNVPDLARHERPFVIDQCAKEAQKIKKSTYTTYQGHTTCDWSAVDIPIRVSTEEALYWLSVHFQTTQFDLKELKQKIKNNELELFSSITDAKEALDKNHHRFSPPILRPLASIFTMEETIALSSDLVSCNSESGKNEAELHDEIFLCYIPYISRKEKIEFANSFLKGKPFTTCIFTPWIEFDANQILKEYSVSFYYASIPLLYLITAKTQKDFDTSFKKIKKKKISFALFKTLFHCCGFDNLDKVDSLLAAMIKKESKDILNYICTYDKVELVEFFIRNLSNVPDTKPFLNWMDKHRIMCLKQFPSIKMDVKFLESWLRNQLANNDSEFDQLVKEVYPEIYNKLRQKSAIAEFDSTSLPAGLLKWLRDPKLKRKRTSPIDDVNQISALTIKGRSLDSDIMSMLIKASKTQESNFSVLLKHLEFFDKDSRQKLSTDLYSQWQQTGMKHKWILELAMLFNIDQDYSDLVGLIEVWPKKRQVAKAVHGLHCLAVTGSVRAVFEIHRLSLISKSQPVQKAARIELSFMANEKDISVDDLLDEIVPRLSFDSKRQQVMDYGPRKFMLSLRDSLKLTIINEKGKVLKNLPQPGVKDNKLLADDCRKRFTQIKKDLRHIIKFQSMRLELALAFQRQWSIENFEKNIVKHPILLSLAKNHIWQAANQSFRISDEMEYLNSQEEIISLSGGNVFLVTSESIQDVSSWNKILIDYELIGLFPQLNRDYVATYPEFSKDFKINGLSLFNILENRNWIRGGIEDSGGTYEHFLHIHNLDMTVKVNYEGVSSWYPEDKTSIHSFEFYKGIHEKVDCSWGEQMIKEDIPKVVLIELNYLKSLIEEKA